MISSRNEVNNDNRINNLGNRMNMLENKIGSPKTDEWYKE